MTKHVLFFSCLFFSTHLNSFDVDPEHKRLIKKVNKLSGTTEKYQNKRLENKIEQINSLNKKKNQLRKKVNYPKKSDGFTVIKNSLDDNQAALETLGFSPEDLKNHSGKKKNKNKKNKNKKKIKKK